MNDTTKYDIAIIGAGPGGYVAAIRASQLGKRVVLIERDIVGGVCLNWGCIPSKALIHQAELFREIPALEKLGIKIDKSNFDYAKVHALSRDAARKLTRGVEGLIKKNSIDHVKGTATIKTPKSIMVQGENASDTKNIEAENIIIATGSSPKVLPGMEFDEDKVLSSTGILSLSKLPKKMIILGAGAIGIEFAYVLSTFGVEISVVEMLPRILPLEDAETSQALAAILKRRGIKFFLGHKSSALRKKDKSVELDIEEVTDGKKQTLQADKVLASVGRAPNSVNLGLETLGIKTERGFITVSPQYETNVPGIYAIGDIVSGTPLLAHVASKEAEIAVEAITGHAKTELDSLRVPAAVYCDPQIASFGLTEEQVKEKQIPYTKAKFPFVAAGKAVAVQKTDGFVKILSHKESGEILGAHILGNSATELIHNLLTASRGELTVHEIATLVHAHPSESEAVMEAARMSEDWAIHI